MLLTLQVVRWLFYILRWRRRVSVQTCCR